MSLPQNQHPSKTGPATSSPFLGNARCSLITGVGRSAVAVISIEGVDAIRVVSNCFRGASDRDWLVGQVRYGTWTGADPSGLAGESVVVTPLAEDWIEVHCHGGPAAIDRILADLQASGVQSVQPDLLKHGDARRLIREAQTTLAGCLTARTAAIAMDQVRGAMQNWATSRLEALTRRELSLDTIHAEVNVILQFTPLGLRLNDPFRVVLVGPPNVGKSSLLNAIVGYDRSITFDGAGTTRDVLHAETVIDGWPVRLSDTAGIRQSSEPIEQEGVQRARFAANQADLMLWVTEPALMGRMGGETFRFSEPLLRSTIPVIRLLNKVDLRDIAAKSLGPPKSDALGQEWDGEVFDLCTSALTGEGIEDLLEMISHQLARFIPDPGAPVPINRRQVETLTEISKSVTREQIEDALNSLLGLVTIVEES